MKTKCAWLEACGAMLGAAGLSVRCAPSPQSAHICLGHDLITRLCGIGTLEQVSAALHETADQGTIGSERAECDGTANHAARYCAGLEKDDLEIDLSAGQRVKAVGSRACILNPPSRGPDAA